MPTYAIETPPITTLPISGTDAVFPVRRVYCIGQNYAAHSIEMGGNPDRDPPFFFQKNPNNLDPSGEFPYPAQTKDVHHELEIAVMLKSGGTDIALADAESHIFGYALSLDMTRRDLQAKQKEMRRPWEVAKAFERSAPVGPIHLVEETGILNDGALSLHVNGEVRQNADLNHMIWKVPEMISYLSDYFELAAGDVILSGTPAGVGSVQRGDVLELAADNLGTFRVTVT